MSEATEVKSSTEIIPSMELTGLETALAKSDELGLRLDSLYDRSRILTAKAIENQEQYSQVGSILSEARSIKKNETAPLFAPFENVINRAKDWLKQKRLVRDNRVAQIEGICLPAMKSFENAEREAAAKEQAKLNKGAKKTEQVAVEPSIPSVAGYRKTTNYYAECIDFDKLLKAFREACQKRDKERALYLRRFLTINEKALAAEARELKNPEQLMKQIPGTKAWKE